MKGRTKWFPRNVPPVRDGEYECIVRITNSMQTKWYLIWDGVGFVTPFPMVVDYWRGLTKKAFIEKTHDKS